MKSIRQNSGPFGGPSLPDFRNLGVWLRILLGTNALAALVALAGNRQLVELPGELALLAASVEPPLIACVASLHALQTRLARLPYVAGVVLVAAVALASTFLTHMHVVGISADATAMARDSVPRELLWTALDVVALLVYFHARARAQSPALTEARLMALTARIRPHFLFNALNAVLGVIRSDPRRAEAALEELSDLFRVLMRDNRELVPLSEEIAVARQYLDLERLRLGERLQVKWEIASCPPDALMPPLMLQPLLENAVYHGIEPSDQPGEITIGFTRRGEQLLIEMTNPYNPAAQPHAGNQMALANIRERLMLFYDLEARLETELQSEAGKDRYLVRIVVPYRPGRKA
ncbi:MAG: histidine kinase [Proteobacteria bacterium]|nr:histidine kinase [Pseudomonadota bacterium]